MEPLTFPDNSAVLFGREQDLAFLAERIQYSGITAVLGQPKMGKSWLLTELARRLSGDSRSAPAPVQSLLLARPQQFLVGFSEQEGTFPDQMLRAVSNLYTRWLANSTYRQQAQIFYQQHKSELVGNVGVAVGSILKELGGLAGKPVEMLSGVIKQTFDGLASANRDLVSGGLQLPRLQSDQARELLACLYKITSLPIVMVLDQWEKSPNLKMEISILDAFLHHLDDWPPCHILLGVRTNNEIRAVLQQLHGGTSYKRPEIGEPMGIYDLPLMNLDAAEKAALPAYLRQRMAEASSLSRKKPPEVSDQQLLEMIGGYPRVIDQWTKPYILRNLTSVGQLQEQVAKANDERYEEFETILSKLNDDERTTAIRLALVPSSSDADDWKALRSILLEGVKASILDKLKSLYVLESVTPPSYGHATQREAAQRWFAAKAQASWSEISEQLIFNLSAQIPDAVPRSRPYSDALIGLMPSTKELKLSSVAEALLQSNLSLFDSSLVDLSKLRNVVSEMEAGQLATAPLLAMGIFNALNRAKPAGDFSLRDELLDELRGLANHLPENLAVRKQLVMGLNNVLNQAKEEGDLPRRNALLKELRAMTKQYPEDADVRERLTAGLHNTLVHLQSEGNLPLRNELLDELRTLAKNFPADAVVRGRLANRLYSAFRQAKSENNLFQRDEFLEEIRVLAENYPEDAAVREYLAVGLYNVINDAKSEGNLPLRDELLEELIALAEDYSEDADVREQLAMGLFNTLNDAKAEGNLPMRNQLLDALRTLAKLYPDDAVVREQLAMGLNNTRADAKDEQNLPLREAMLDELRALAKDYPDDTAVGKRLAKGLAGAIIDASEGQDSSRAETLLEELRVLASAHPEDETVRESYENSRDFLA